MTVDLTRLIKPLEWNGTCTGRSSDIFGPLYHVSKQSSSPELWSWGIDGEGWAGSGVTIEAAQAAANADYVAHVLAPIDTALIAELVEAAKEVGRISDRDHVAWHRLAAALAEMNGDK
jgi:hypothetical protein